MNSKKNLNDNFFKNLVFLSIFISIVVFIIILGFTKIFYNFDRSLGEELYKHKNKISSDIVLVGIDEKSVNKIGRFPFSRKEYIPVIENLKKKGVMVIGFDIIFADKTNDEDDIAFAKSIKKAGNVVLGGGIVTDKDTKESFFEYPLNILLKGALNIGYYKPVTDKKTQKVYSINPQRLLGKKNDFSKKEKINHFAIALLKSYYSLFYENKKYLNYKNNYKKGDDFFTIVPSLNNNKGIKVPYDNRGDRELGINFIPDDKIPFFSFLDIKNNNFKKEDVENKIVIIGATANGIKDTFLTHSQKRFGIYTHINVVNTVLTKNYKVYFGKYLELILIFFLIILSVYFNLSLSGKKLLLSNVGIIAIFMFIILYITNYAGYILNFAGEFIFAIIITLTISNILKSFMEDKSKRILLDALGDYVSPEVAKEILTGEGNINLDGERKKISIFFSDIEGFTTISEKMKPRELVLFLREYLGEMSTIILENKGTIDKFEGDAIMALWGTFSHGDTSTFDSCYSAIKQQEKLKILNTYWKENFGEELKIRMGINTGEAIVGNIGVKGGKLEYTALGDSVNLSSRLEEVNKKYGTYLCVSEAVFVEQKTNFDFRYLDQIKVKGKNVPVKIYELISLKGEISSLKKDIVEKFEKAIKLYLEKKFDEALILFEELASLGDNPSKTYIGRCEIFTNNPPDENWDGVWTMKTK